MNKNFNRIIDRYTKETLDKNSFVLLEGFNGCGKTILGGKYSKSIISLTGDNKDEFLFTADTKPLNLLTGEYPRLIDGVEVKPKMVDAVNLFLSTKKEGKFILASSVSLSCLNKSSSFPTIFVYPLSLFESKESNGNVSLKSVFDKKKVDNFKLSSNLNLEQLIFSTCRGGFPESLLAIDKDEKLRIPRAYLYSALKEEINYASDTKRDFSKALAICKTFSKNLYSLEKNTFLSKESKKLSDMARTSYFAYKKSLKDIFLLHELKPWNTNLRSKGVVVSNPKFIFADPSLAIASLNLKPKDFQTGLLKFSYYFKNLVMRDLLVYSQPLGGKLFYYSDRYGLDVDCVLELEDGRYALINIELGSSNIEESSKRLNKLKSVINLYNENKKIPLMSPMAKIIITGSQHGMIRDDGVLVIPIGCLRD